MSLSMATQKTNTSNNLIEDKQCAADDVGTNREYLVKLKTKTESRQKGENA